MTKANRRENIRLEWERAQSALRSALLLSEHGEYADAVSRAFLRDASRHQGSAAHPGA
jgi:uncharacterized protein (UPF0332 family)